MGIGITDYKQYIGTNLNPEIKDSIQENRNMLSDPIGVNGVLLTSDGYIVLARRANWVAVHSNKLETPGAGLAMELNLALRSR